MTQTLMSSGPQVMELLGHLSLQCMLQVVCLEFFAKVFFILWTCNLMLFPFYDFCTEIDKPLLVNLSYPILSYYF